MDKIKVLLVDDHVLFRAGMRRLLAFYDDIEVAGEAGSGEEALDSLTKSEPDVILMDVNMPGEGGVAATATIRAAYSHCRVILLSGHRKFAAAGLRAGASGYVLKVANEEEIIGAIRMVYGGGVYLQPEIQPLVVGVLQSQSTINLSEREVDVLRLVAQGISNRAIGARLKISEDRVKQHISLILEKLRAHDRAHAVAIAVREGIV
jgi:DNA-binding NarL/FixJ family response regulator